jgi:CubicO group peptidase (beta-lactamase class C family)
MRVSFGRVYFWYKGTEFVDLPKKLAYTVNARLTLCEPLGVLLNEKALSRTYWPTAAWQSTSPAAQQLDGDLLLKLGDILEADFPEVHSLLVIRHGYLVFERYYRGYDANKPHEIRSATKSVISALIGIALKEGYLTSLDQKIVELLPEYFESNTDLRKNAMTVRHLLTMTSGLEADEKDSNFWHFRSKPDWALATLELPLLHEVGQKFCYDSMANHLLSVILTKQTGMNALAYAQTRLFEPLGINVEDWPADPQGNSEGGAGLILTPREMAKFGYLYLNEGFWEGKEIIPEWFVRESIQVHSEGGNPEPAAYGYLWWVIPRFKPFAYCAAGYGGQYIFVVPDNDLVIVTTGNHTLVPAPVMPVPLIFKHIVPLA